MFAVTYLFWEEPQDRSLLNWVQQQFDWRCWSWRQVHVVLITDKAEDASVQVLTETHCQRKANLWVLVSYAMDPGKNATHTTCIIWYDSAAQYTLLDMLSPLPGRYKHLSSTTLFLLVWEIYRFITIYASFNELKMSWSSIWVWNLLLFVVCRERFHTGTLNLHVHVVVLDLDLWMHLVNFLIRMPMYSWELCSTFEFIVSDMCYVC